MKQPRKIKGLQKLGRVAGLKAALLLAEKPYKAIELVQALGVHQRIVYRILADLRATGNLHYHRWYYWYDPKKNNDLQHLIPIKNSYV
jgi:predicted ArsR family transcriptional regulator